MKATERGFAERIDFDTMTTETIRVTIRKVLTNPKYLENAKKLSIRFRDQKEKPLERAVWWAEWLIRNPDCDYLKSPVLKLGFIIGNSYDIIAAISMVLFLTLIVLIKICSLFIRKLNLFSIQLKRENYDSNKSKEN